MPTETLLVKIDIDDDDADLTKQEKHRLAIKNITEEKKALEAANKKGQLTEKEYIQEITKAETALKKERIEYGKATQAVTGHKSVIDKLTDAVNKNTAQSGLHTKALELTTNQLDRLVPGFGAARAAVSSFTTTMEGATLAEIAFLGPLALIALALVPIIAFLKGTGEGQDLVARKTAEANAVLKIFGDEIFKIGKALLGFPTEYENNGLIKFLSLVVQYTPNIYTLSQALYNLIPEETRNDLEEAAQLAGDLADALDQIKDAEEDFGIEASKTENVIKRLLLQAKNRTLTEEQRIALLDKAVEKEKELTDQRELFAVQEFNILITLNKKRLEAIGIVQKAGETNAEFAERNIDSIRDLDEELASSIIKSLIAIEDAAGASIAIEEKAANLRDKLLDDQAEKAEKRRQDELKRIAEFEKKRDEVVRQQRLTSIREYANYEANISLDLAEQKLSSELLFAQGQQSVQNAINKGRQESAEVQSDIERRRVDEAIDSATRLSQGLTALGIKNRILQSGIALANTFVAVTEILAEKSLLPFPASVIAKGAAIVGTVATGLAAVAKINGIGFFDGGYTGRGNPRTESTTLGTRPYVYHKDEYITPSRVLNTPEGAYHVGQLEKMRSGRSGIHGFFDGGYAISEDSTRSSGRIAAQNQNMRGMLEAISNLQLVVYADDISAKQRVNYNQRARARVL